MRKRNELSQEPETLHASMLALMSLMLLLIGGLLMSMEVLPVGALAVRVPMMCNLGQEFSENAEAPIKVTIERDGFHVSRLQSDPSLGESVSYIPLRRESGSELLDFAALTRVARRLKSPAATSYGVVTLVPHGEISLQAIVSTMDALRGGGCSARSVAASGQTGIVDARCLYPVVELQPMAS